MKLTLSDEYRETMAIDAPGDFLPTKLNVYKGKEGEGIKIDRRGGE